jgi:hypothetical protein
MPTRLAIRQPIVNDKSNGKFDDGIRVGGFWRRDVRHVNVEILAALTAIMSRILQDNVNGATGRRIAEVMQLPRWFFASSCEMLTVRASRFFSAMGTIFDDRRGQVIGICDSFGWVGHVVAGAGHGNILLDSMLKEDTLPYFPFLVKLNSPVLSLQSLFLPWLRHSASNFCSKSAHCGTRATQTVSPGEK